MNNDTISKLTAELDSAARGRRFGRFFALGPMAFAVDLRLPDHGVLLFNCDPSSQRVHFAKRRQRDLEKQSVHPNPFISGLKRRVEGATVDGIRKFEADRVVEISLAAENDLGEPHDYSIIVQLTGSSSNIFLLDSDGAVLDRMRETTGAGQTVGERYQPPQRSGVRGSEKPDPFDVEGTASISEAVDRYYEESAASRLRDARVRSARARISGEISKRSRLLKKLAADIESHGEAGRWKRYGDILLANVADARKTGKGFIVKDYFDPALSEICIPAEDSDSVTEAAEKYFKRYTKARNAAEQVARRVETVEEELRGLESERDRLEEAISRNDMDAVPDMVSPRPKTPDERKKKATAPRGVRHFVSSDGYDIYVGKGSKDNDALTFKIAKSYDLWLHAADYPGSHVVVRSRKNEEVPHTTLLEAAQLAAFYSDARGQGKAAVNYTLKKFVNKPRGASPGLVSLSGFKTVLVPPAVPSGTEAA